MIDSLLTVLRFGILILSLSGFYYIAKHALNVVTFVVPLFVLSCITLVVYIGGLLGLLLPSVISVTLFGIGGFFLLFEEKRRTLRHQSELSIASIFFAVGSVLFLSLVLFCHFDHQDNFSHWASVVKTMLLTNAFPSNDASIVIFTDYPLGSACFLYYVCSIVGSSQGVMLFAQTLFILACFYACFGIITETKRFFLYIFLATGCSALSFFHTTIRLNNLLVDFWMPVMSVAIMATIFRYRDDFPKACILVCPSLAFLILIKNSSFFFVLLVMIVLFYVAHKETESKDPPA